MRDWRDGPDDGLREVMLTSGMKLHQEVWVDEFIRDFEVMIGCDVVSNDLGQDIR